MNPAEEAILLLATERGADKSICPSEAARLLAENWRGQMTIVRAAAIRLARAGRIEILRKGKPVDDLDDLRVVIRLRIKQ